MTSQLIPISQSRCGTCPEFKNHTCPRNDLYLKPDYLVQKDFACKCNLNDEVKVEA